MYVFEININETHIIFIGKLDVFLLVLLMLVYLTSEMLTK